MDGARSLAFKTYRKDIVPWKRWTCSKEISVEWQNGIIRLEDAQAPSVSNVDASGYWSVPKDV